MQKEKRFLVEIQVNEEKLRESTENYEESIDFLVSQELGWVEASGIGVVDIKEESLAKVYEIEDRNGNTIMSFMVDEKGNPVKLTNCSYADTDGDYLYDTEFELVRIQQD